MPINTKSSYIEIGTGVAQDGVSLVNALQLPAPTSLPARDEFLVDAERNTEGTLIAQQIGRTQYTFELSWSKLKNTTLWAINRWFRENGYFFYVKFFSHTDGAVKICRFYRGEATEGIPSTQQETISGISVPAFYLGFGFSVIDMGESEVITVQEISIT